MNTLLKKLKRGIPRDTVRQARLRPTLTAKLLAEKNLAMIEAAVKLEIAHDIVKGLLNDDSTFGDIERAHRWLTTTHAPDNAALQAARQDIPA